MLSHEPGKLGIAGELAPPGSGAAGDRHPLRGERPVLPAGRVEVAAQLAADRGRAAAHLPGDCTHTLPAPMQLGDRQPFVLTQDRVEISRTGELTPVDSAAGDRCCW
jgi:hypothetical protein